MSLLTLVQTAAQRIGIPSPLQVATSTDTQVLQLMALANSEGIDLAARYQWQALIQQTTFLTVATPVTNQNNVVQGSLSTIAPGMKYLLNDVMWNRDLRRPVFGPKSIQTSQQLSNWNMVGPWNQFFIRGNNLIFLPAPTAGQTIDLAYVTKFWCTTDGMTPTSSSYINDTDVSLLDEDLMAFGLVWRWNKSKNLPYAEDYATYERLVTDAMNRDGSKDILNMGEFRYSIYPAVYVPAGNWGGH